jgi:hypothetical protein
VKLNKAEVQQILQTEYVNGNASLYDLAKRLKCTAPALAYYGRMFFTDWNEHTAKRRIFAGQNFSCCITTGEGLESKCSDKSRP